MLAVGGAAAAWSYAPPTAAAVAAPMPVPVPVPPRVCVDREGAVPAVESRGAAAEMAEAPLGEEEEEEVCSRRQRVASAISTTISSTLASTWSLLNGALLDN